ncbi:MAG: hypothetical protein RLZZ32_1391 [Cyanobacteriota bacterium]
MGLLVGLAVVGRGVCAVLLTAGTAIDRSSLVFRDVQFCCRGNGMNAADQVRSLELAQAIASVAALFRSHFPDAKANLAPWRDDDQTRAFADRESLDLSFHLPGWSPRSQCRSFLVQLRLEGAPGAACPRLLGVTIRGLTYESERWRLATVGDWQPTGTHLPQPAVVEALQAFCRGLFHLFAGGKGGSADPLAA